MMTAPTYLLVDNSNTRTKIMRAQGGQLLPGKRTIPTADITAESIAQLVQDWDYDEGIICSVVPAAQPAIRAGLAVPCHVLAWDSPHGVDFASYPDHAHLGADRIANVIALRSRGKAAAIAIDLGTAITYDVLSQGEDGVRFLGGIIAPGLAAFSAYLADKTALLPKTEWFMPASPLGQCTEEAIQSGISLGFRGMVRESIASLRAELGGQVYVVATGGDAPLVVDMVDELAEDLTFEGLLTLTQAMGV